MKHTAIRKNYDGTSGVINGSSAVMISRDKVKFGKQEGIEDPYNRIQKKPPAITKAQTPFLKKSV